MSEPAESGLTGTAATLDAARQVEPSDQFLSSLTSAMRRVADDARETSLSDARAAVAAKIAAMRDAASSRAAELRTRAEQDVTGIGDWSRAEIVRIEAETQRKIEHRRAQLAEQLDEHDQRSAAQIAALEAQVEQYERELALFFSQLGEITDPDTFIAAARRMPRLPQADREPETESDSGVAEEAAAEAHEERLRSLGIERNGEADLADGETAPTNGTEPGPETVAAEASPATGENAEAVEPVEAVATPTAVPPTSPTAAAAPEVETALSDATTIIAAVGLGSFGAVTSFKSALEKADGVTGVRLSLGSSGEFMYTVTHRSDVDLAGLASAAHPGASVQRADDGVMHLTAGKRR